MARWPPLISEVVCFQGMRRRAPFCRHLAIEDRKPPGVVNTSCNQPDAELEALSGVRRPLFAQHALSKEGGSKATPSLAGGGLRNPPGHRRGLTMLSRSIKEALEKK